MALVRPLQIQDSTKRLDLSEKGVRNCLLASLKKSVYIHGHLNKLPPNGGDKRYREIVEVNYYITLNHVLGVSCYRIVRKII